MSIQLIPELCFGDTHLISTSFLTLSGEKECAGSEASVSFYKMKTDFPSKLSAQDVSLFALRVQEEKKASKLAELLKVKKLSERFNRGPFVRTIAMTGTEESGVTVLRSLMPKYDRTLFTFAAPRQRSEPKPEIVVRSIAAQLLSAVAILHHKGYAHRDLSGGNVLLNDLPNKQFSVHIGDMGFAIPSADGQKIPTQFIGTVAYRAPEVLLRSSQYDPRKGDIWAAGINIHHMMTGELAFLSEAELKNFSKHSHEAMKENYQLNYTFKKLATFDPHNMLEYSPCPDFSSCLRNKESLRGGDALCETLSNNTDYSPMAQEFLAWLLQPNPAKRPTALEALQHKWMEPEWNMINALFSEYP